MPKMKTKSGAKKRFRVRGSGSIKRSQAFNRHILTNARVLSAIVCCAFDLQCDLHFASTIEHVAASEEHAKTITRSDPDIFSAVLLLIPSQYWNDICNFWCRGLFIIEYHFTDCRFEINLVY